MTSFDDFMKLIFDTISKMPVIICTNIKYNGYTVKFPLYDNGVKYNVKIEAMKDIYIRRNVYTGRVENIAERKPEIYYITINDTEILKLDEDTKNYEYESYFKLLNVILDSKKKELIENDNES